jgi:hypothetical protein
MAENVDEGLDGDRDADVDDDAVRRLFLAQAGPPVDVESGLEAVLGQAGRRRMRRMLAPIVVGLASAAAVAAVVLVRVGSDDAELVPAGPGTDLPAVMSDRTSASPATSPSTSPRSPSTTVQPGTSAPSVSTTGAPASAPTAAVTSPPAVNPPITAPATAPPTAQTQTFSCAGGSVTVRWTPAGLLLVSVSPAAGWTIEDQVARSDRVEARFGAADQQESELRLRLRDGSPTLECRD